MNNNKLTSTIFGLIFLVLLGTVIYFFGKMILQLDVKISVAVIMFIASLITLLLNHRYTKNREIAEAHRGKKVEIYQKFLNIVASMQGGDNEQLSVQPLTEQELADKLFEFKNEIILWGSAKVIQAQLEFEEKSQLGSAEVLVAMNNIYLAIREDIGLKNSGLNNFELVKMHLSNPDELDVLLKQ